MAKKHFVVDCLSWLPYKRDFINSTILETYEDIPNTLPSLKLLEKRVRELVGGGGPLSPLLDNVVSSKGLRSGRVNFSALPPPNYFKIILFQSII